MGVPLAGDVVDTTFLTLETVVAVALPGAVAPGMDKFCPMRMVADLLSPLAEMMLDTLVP